MMQLNTDDSIESEVKTPAARLIRAAFFWDNFARCQLTTSEEEE